MACLTCSGLNEQNPERGIETVGESEQSNQALGLNEQNPERGIETAPIATGRSHESNV